MSLFKLPLLVSILALSFSVNAAKPTVLNVQVGEEIRYLDPQISTGIGSAHIAINLFEGLYEYGHKTGDPTKALAISHKTNKDASVWTFKLRDDYHWVKFDGKNVQKMRKLTAHDFVYSFRRILAPATASEYAYMLYIIKNGKAENEIKNDNHPQRKQGNQNLIA